ncbi:DUF2817 domain-containing protein [Oceanibium sediminis]|uniref:DUF2817 domain-containing protein n=1 Tax=Oceanibium sediminis TaxID=2026339 RepID=UPI000DD390A0|nr:DUF2817 domain-containing protein [Oceanibium sediminis]
MTPTTREYYALYTRCRTAFRMAAEEQGWQLTNVSHPLSSDTMAYGVDVARIGAPDAKQVLFVLSGVHGTELEAGAIAQQDLLHRLPDECPEHTAIVLIHGVNPYGCAHLSRTDENNVDPNRNVRARLDQTPRNEAYDQLHAALCPQDWEGPVRDAAEQQLAAFIEQNGMRVLTQEVLRGQYDHPDGLFYGGRSVSWTVQTLQSLLETHAKGATRLAILDIHTGVGPKGWGELIRLDRAAVEGAEWSGIGGCVCDLADRVPTEQLPLKVIIEFGTRDFRRVVDALRGDTWLRYHEATEAQRADIKKQLYTALVCANPEWRAGVISQTRTAARALLRDLCGAATAADSALDRFGQAVSAAQAPGDAYRALQALSQTVIGARLFTIMELVDDTRAGQRIYSSEPASYPVSGIIPLKDNLWYDTAVRQQRPFVANDASGLQAVFADHELIASLGCASVLNLPITLDGKLEATVNLLDVAGHYDAERVALAQDTLTEPARAALRMERSLRECHAQNQNSDHPTIETA